MTGPAIPLYELEAKGVRCPSGPATHVAEVDRTKKVVVGKLKPDTL